MLGILRAPWSGLLPARPLLRLTTRLCPQASPLSYVHRLFVRHNQGPSTVSSNPSAAPPPVSSASSSASTAYSVSQLIWHLLSGFHTGRRKENEILQLLESLSAEDLNAVLQRVDLRRLIRRVDDRLFLGPRNRSGLFNLLVERRINDLAIETRAALVHAVLQTRISSAHRALVLERVFLATRGTDLKTLRVLVDTGPHHYDMQSMLFDASPSTRALITNHIRAEAQRLGRRGVRLYSDIDDTLYCSLHDRRFPRGTTYPGVLQLYAELAAHRDANDSNTGSQSSPPPPDAVVFVTARPTAVGGLVEHWTKRALRARGLPRACVLTGDTRHLLGERMARKKLDQIAFHAEHVYPDDDLVFVGDSGQQDLAVAVRLAHLFPQRVRLALIHQVLPRPPAPHTVPAGGPTDAVRLFDTYVGAACEAFRRALISGPALHRVCAAARAETALVPFENEAQRTAAFRLLARDVQTAEALAPMMGLTGNGNGSASSGRGSSSSSNGSAGSG